MIVDLVRVRQGREKLALLAQKYPELRGERSAANVMQWEKTLESIGENEVEYERKCKYILCGKTFMAGRKDKEFCCDAHRTAANKLRENEPSSLSKLLSRAVEFDAQFYGHPSNPDVKRARDAALHDVYDAIRAELGIVQAPVNEPENEQDEPENDAKKVDLTPDEVREKLRAWMLETGHGQTKVAKLAGVGQPTISLFLAGKTDGSKAFRQSIFDVFSQDHGMDRR